MFSSSPPPFDAEPPPLPDSPPVNSCSPLSTPSSHLDLSPTKDDLSGGHSMFSPPGGVPTGGGRPVISGSPPPFHFSPPPLQEVLQVSERKEAASVLPASEMNTGYDDDDEFDLTFEPASSGGSNEDDFHSFEPLPDNTEPVDQAPPLDTVAAGGSHGGDDEGRKPSRSDLPPLPISSVLDTVAGVRTSPDDDDLSDFMSSGREVHANISPQGSPSGQLAKDSSAILSELSNSAERLSPCQCPTDDVPSELEDGLDKAAAAEDSAARTELNVASGTEEGRSAADLALNSIDRVKEEVDADEEASEKSTDNSDEKGSSEGSLPRTPSSSPPEDKSSAMADTAPEVVQSDAQQAVEAGGLHSAEGREEEALDEDKENGKCDSDGRTAAAEEPSMAPAAAPNSSDVLEDDLPSNSEELRDESCCLNNAVIDGDEMEVTVGENQEEEPKNEVDKEPLFDDAVQSETDGFPIDDGGRNSGMEFANFADDSEFCWNETDGGDGSDSWGAFTVETGPAAFGQTGQEAGHFQDSGSVSSAETRSRLPESAAKDSFLKLASIDVKTVILSVFTVGSESGEVPIVQEEMSTKATRDHALVDPLPMRLRQDENIWKKVEDPAATPSLDHSWFESNTYDVLLKTLNIDTRIMLEGDSWKSSWSRKGPTPPSSILIPTPVGPTILQPVNMANQQSATVTSLKNDQTVNEVASNVKNTNHESSPEDFDWSLPAPTTPVKSPETSEKVVQLSVSDIKDCATLGDQTARGSGGDPTGANSSLAQMSPSQDSWSLPPVASASNNNDSWSLPASSSSAETTATGIDSWSLPAKSGGGAMVGGDANRTARSGISTDASSVLDSFPLLSFLSSSVLVHPTRSVSKNKLVARIFSK